MELDQTDPRTLQSAQWSPEHIGSLDMVVASGLTVTLNGKEWHFTPPRYRDIGEVVQQMRSEAYATYEITQRRLRKDHNIYVDYKERRSDINGILYGIQGQDLRTMLLGPTVAPRLLKLSLQKHHPDVTDEDIDMFLDDPEAANMLLTVFIEMTLGPRALSKEGDESPDPTKKVEQSSSAST